MKKPDELESGKKGAYVSFRATDAVTNALERLRRRGRHGRSRSAIVHRLIVDALRRQRPNEN